LGDIPLQKLMADQIGNIILMRHCHQVRHVHAFAESDLAMSDQVYLKKVMAKALKVAFNHTSSLEYLRVFDQLSN
jgi:hypothetical protein